MKGPSLRGPCTLNRVMAITAANKQRKQHAAFSLQAHAWIHHCRAYSKPEHRDQFNTEYMKAFNTETVSSKVNSEFALLVRDSKHRFENKRPLCLYRLFHQDRCVLFLKSRQYSTIGVSEIKINNYYVVHPQASVASCISSSWVSVKQSY